MKLYYAPGACSLVSAHRGCASSDSPLEPKKVDLSKHEDARRRRRLPRNQRAGLCAGARARRRREPDRRPGDPAVPRRPQARQASRRRAGTLERYRLQEWLNFITSEVHKQFWPLFKPTRPTTTRRSRRRCSRRASTGSTAQLAGKELPDGQRSSPWPTRTCFTLLGWTRPLKVDLAPLAEPARIPQARRRACRRCRKRCRPKAC